MRIITRSESPPSKLSLLVLPVETHIDYSNVSVKAFPSGGRCYQDEPWVTDTSMTVICSVTSAMAVYECHESVNAPLHLRT